MIFYNQASADLGSIRAWWNALPTMQQDTQETVDRLVDRAERIMRAEHVGWVQEMQDAMTQFRFEQSAEAEAASGTAGHDRTSVGTRRRGTRHGAREWDDASDGQRTRKRSAAATGATA